MTAITGHKHYKIIANILGLTQLLVLFVIIFQYGIKKIGKDILIVKHI